MQKTKIKDLLKHYKMPAKVQEILNTLGYDSYGSVVRELIENKIVNLNGELLGWKQDGVILTADSKAIEYASLGEEKEPEYEMGASRKNCSYFAIRDMTIKEPKKVEDPMPTVVYNPDHAEIERMFELFERGLPDSGTIDDTVGRPTVFNSRSFVQRSRFRPKEIDLSQDPRVAVLCGANNYVSHEAGLPFVDVNMYKEQGIPSPLRT